jgi:hypothetical protein
LPMPSPVSTPSFTSAGVVSAVDAETYAAVNAGGTRAVAAAADAAGASRAHLQPCRRGACARIDAARRRRRTCPADAIRTKRLDSERGFSPFRPPALDNGSAARRRLWSATRRPAAVQARGRPRGARCRPPRRGMHSSTSPTSSARSKPLEGSSGGTFFVGHPQPVTPRGLLETIQKHDGPPQRACHRPDADRALRRRSAMSSGG